ncbi:MAG: glycosyl hydrolase, partial [Flavitalea sp.]
MSVKRFLSPAFCYHRDSINAKWQGKGWRAWEVVKAAKPRFNGYDLRSILITFVILFANFIQVNAQFRHPSINTLRKGFINPPEESRPGVYWYFMDGNLSKKGITSDLEAMKKAGIGTVLFLEVNVGLPRGNVDFLGKEWKEIFAHAVHECERLNISMALALGPGWNGSGGPWVPTDESMQHLVSSTTNVRGGSNLTISLPVPKPKTP